MTAKRMVQSLHHGAGYAQSHRFSRDKRIKLYDKKKTKPEISVKQLTDAKSYRTTFLFNRQRFRAVFASVGEILYLDIKNMPINLPSGTSVLLFGTSVSRLVFRKLAWKKKEWVALPERPFKK